MLKINRFIARNAMAQAEEEKCKILFFFSWILTSIFHNNPSEWADQALEKVDSPSKIEGLLLLSKAMQVYCV